MSAPVWKGLFEYSMRHSDGTKPSNFKAEDLDMDKMKWLEEALKSYMVDFAARMVEIKKSLDKDDESLSLESREDMLDELMDIVSSIDYARDLHTIGGLPTLLDLLSSPHASLRSKSAEVIATCVANNPPVQQWFLDGGVLPLLLHLLASDPSPSVRTKVLLALSSLVREHPPSLRAFQGSPPALPALVAALCAAGEPRLQRKAANLLQYVIASDAGSLRYGGSGGAGSGVGAGVGAAGGSGGSSGAPGSVSANGVAQQQQQTAGANGVGCAAAAATTASDDASAAATNGVSCGMTNGSAGATATAGQVAVAGGVLPPLLHAVTQRDDPDLREAALKLLLQLAEGSDTWGDVKGLEGLAAAVEALLDAHGQLSLEDLEAVAEEISSGKALQALLARNTAPAATQAVEPSAATAGDQQPQQPPQPVLALCAP